MDDVLCTSGPQDRPFEEQHSGVSIAIVWIGEALNPDGRSWNLEGEFRAKRIR